MNNILFIQYYKRILELVKPLSQPSAGAEGGDTPLSEASCQETAGYTAALCRGRGRRYSNSSLPIFKFKIGRAGER
jgi:hypothetical protein